MGLVAGSQMQTSPAPTLLPMDTGEGYATLLLPGQELLVDSLAVGWLCPGISVPQQDPCIRTHMWDFPLRHLQPDP